MPLRLHHIGFVVASIEDAMPGFVRSMMAEWDGQSFEDPLQKAKVAFLATRVGDALLELVEPLSEDSPVQRFLQEKGGGLHHVCYEVVDLEQELTDFRGRGAVIAQPSQAGGSFWWAADRVGDHR